MRPAPPSTTVHTSSKPAAAPFALHIDGDWLTLTNESDQAANNVRVEIQTADGVPHSATEAGPMAHGDQVQTGTSEFQPPVSPSAAITSTRILSTFPSSEQGLRRGGHALAVTLRGTEERCCERMLNSLDENVDYLQCLPESRFETCKAKAPKVSALRTMSSSGT